MCIKRLNMRIVASAMTEKELFNALAIAIIVKTKHSSSVIHNYTKSGLAKLVGCSPATLGRAIERWRQVGMCHFEGRNLVFAKITSGKHTIPAKNIPITFKEVKKYLHILMLQLKLRKIDYAKHLRTRKSIRKKYAKGGYKHIGAELTIHTVARVICRSVPTAIKYLNEGNKKNWIRKHREDLMPIDKAKEIKRFKRNQRTRTFWFYGVEYFQFCNIYSLA